MSTCTNLQVSGAVLAAAVEAARQRGADIVPRDISLGEAKAAAAACCSLQVFTA